MRAIIFIIIMEKIPCTLGMLTYNSADTLAGALESVKEFGEILISDGGSTDATLEIARQYGCRIIEQSNPGHPIGHFALERNRMVEAASYDWFFYIDSDERATPELVEAIRTAVTVSPAPHLVYWVCFRKTSPDFSHTYRTFKEYYQPRFFNRTTGARFIRPMHERISYDEKKYPAGRIHAPWLVALYEDDLDFFPAMAKSRKRIRVLANAWQPLGVGDVLQRILLYPLVSTGKSFFKMVYVKLRYGKDAIPAAYELLRIHSDWAQAYFSLIRLLRGKTNHG